MGKREYLQDKKFYIIIYFIGIILAMTVSILDFVLKGEYINLNNVIYALFISIVLLGIFLYIDFKKKDKFLSIIGKNLDEDRDMKYVFDLPDGLNNEYDYIKKTYIKNYSNYIEKLDSYKDRSDLQVKFNNRWIHEMKTPISVMKLILDREDLSRLDKEDISIKNSLEEELDKLSNGLEMSLYTLRINDFEEDFKVEKIDILEEVRAIINENRSIFISTSVYPKILFEEGYVVTTDRKWIRFVLKQLIINSVKYTKVKDIGNKEIKIDMKEEGNRLILSIEDNGIGMLESDLRRIFDPFFTGSNGRKYLESTGMGLYLVKEILERLGHRIDVESQENLYSKFSISFYEGQSIYNLE